MTSQEQDLLLNDVLSVSSENGSIIAAYDERPQAEFVRDWSAEEVGHFSSSPEGLQGQLQL